MDHGKMEPADFAKLESCGTTRIYKTDDLVFAEGEPADKVYFVESGRLSVFLYEFTNRVEIGQLDSGDFFGEMAVINKSKRAASVSVVADAKILVLDKEHFLKLLHSDGAVSEKINRIITSRTEDLVFKENLLATTGISGNKLQISIKGDPSLRETAFMRERHESVVDKVLPELIVKLNILLLERCVTEIFLQFNSGEIRLTSILDPFNYKMHPANKLIDDAYLDRHFPVFPYEEKTRLIRHLYQTIAAEFDDLPLSRRCKDTYRHHYQSWQPLDPEEITRVIAKIPLLRHIPDFYLRNMGVSITRDAIRMQFNCDGTHIVSTRDYSQFLADNVVL